MPHFAPGAVHEYLRAKWVYGVQGSRKYMGDLTCFICSVLSNNFYDRPRKHQANVRKILDRDHNLQGNTVLQPEHGYRYLTFYFLFFAASFNGPEFDIVLLLCRSTLR